MDDCGFAIIPVSFYMSVTGEIDRPPHCADIRILIKYKSDF